MDVELDRRFTGQVVRSVLVRGVWLEFNELLRGLSRLGDRFCCGFVRCSSWVVLLVLRKDCSWFWDSIEVEVEGETNSFCTRKARLLALLAVSVGIVGDLR
ncbi:hypothetical protein Droror1_Dr00016396 [Drosera rotundifolia]